MKGFHVADLGADGEVRASTEYAYEALQQVPGATELIADFSSQLYQSPTEFELSSLYLRPNMSYRWHSSASTAGISTLRDGGLLVSLGLLASGINADADRITLEAFQSHLLRELHGTQHEPAFDLLMLEQRPLLVTVGFSEPAEKLDHLLAALADRCFAAAYFRYLHLV